MNGVRREGRVDEKKKRGGDVGKEGSRTGDGYRSVLLNRRVE